MERRSALRQAPLDGRGWQVWTGGRAAMMDVGIFGIGDVPAQPNGMRLPMKWNNTTRPYDRDVRLESLIEARASLHPHDVVAVSDEGELTFSDLDRLANKLANHLLAADVGRGDYVIICLERTNAYLITVLAVLKTGAAFIPIEIEEPASRIAEIAAAEGVAFAVIEQIVAGAFEPLELYTVVLDLQQLERSQLAETRPSVGIASGDGRFSICWACPHWARPCGSSRATNAGIRLPVPGCCNASRSLSGTRRRLCYRRSSRFFLRMAVRAGSAS
ncbi:hypothetical protein BMJ31_30155 [Sinorhizobium medicae]|nr:hypothetical protein BMJ31_30155 [Sinorhizobium medicae]